MLSARRLAPWLGLAVLCHVPLAPLVDVSSVARYFRPQSANSVVAPVAEIPVELDAAAAIPATADEQPSSRSNPTRRSDADVDAEAEANATASEADAFSAPASVKKRRRARQRRPAPAPVVPAPSRPANRAAHLAGSESIADPAAAVAELKLPSASSSLRLLLHVERLRGHALAAPVAALLRGVGQWHGLFQDGALDPMRDIDRLLLVAPDARDSHGAISVFDYNVQRFRVRQAVVSDASRVCVFPSPSTLVIGAPSDRASVESIPRSFKLPGSSLGELFVLHVEKPAQGSLRLPWAFPSSVRWVRLQVTLTQQGNASVALLARDASPAAAARSAQSLTATLGTTVVAQAESLRATLGLAPEAVQSLLEASLAALGPSRALADADGGPAGEAQQADAQQQPRQQ